MREHGLRSPALLQNAYPLLKPVDCLLELIQRAQHGLIQQACEQLGFVIKPYFGRRLAVVACFLCLSFGITIFY